MYEQIPDELKKHKQWVCWKAVPDESRPGKMKKLPINPYTGGLAQSNNAKTWADYTSALSVCKQYNGIGFMFTGGYFGVDIDGVDGAITDYRNGDSDNIVAEFIHTLQSYAEYSVSGKGIHIICKGKLPQGGRRKKNVEMYESGRFFIMTGNRAAEYLEIAEGSERIKPLHEKYIGGGNTPTTGIIKAMPLNLTDSEVLKLAEKSKQGKTFSDLYNGNWEGYFTSQSEADLSFCNMLAFWCRCDEQLMDRIFRSSGLMRPKWERKQSGSTYGALTIKKAIKACKKVYEPQAEYRIGIGARQKPNKPKKLYSFDDTGNAQRFLDTFQDSVRYSYINKNWMYYDGRRWCFDITGALRKMADEVVEEMRYDFDYYMENCPQNMDVEEYERQFLKHIKLTRSNKAKTAMLKEAEHHVAILPDDLDQHKSLLNVVNGMINLRTGELLAHDREQYITKISPVEYTDKIDCPLWDSFLNDIFNHDKDLIRYVQKAVGYSICGSTREHCVFFCYGNGRNGKSTFLDVLSEMLGDYAVNIQPETIMVRANTSSNTGDIARLKGARFVTTVEPNEGVRINEGLLKQMAGGDRITACKKYENEFEFTPEFKLWMGTNYKPIIRGTDVGIWSRIHLVPFTVQIPDSKMDKNLKHKLKQELPAILKWAVEGCLLWQREGLKKPLVVENATREYKNEMDVVSLFLDECCITGCGETKASDLYQIYKQWAKENGEYEMRNTKFGIEMGKKFEKVRKTDGYYYLGIIVQDLYKIYKINFENYAK